jgi:hypothetical protein
VGLVLPSLVTRARRVATGGAIFAGVAALLAPAPPAEANGRPPSTVSIATRPNGRDILVATTFGVLLSKDDGCSFQWLCEQSIGFGGTFDPKYAIGADGTLFATTFEGLRVSRDGGCTWETATAGLPPGDPGALEHIWVDAIDLAPNGDVWLATAESGRYNDVYRSRDNARTFQPMGLHSAAIWWKSVKVSEKDPQRLYVTGYQIAGTAPGGGQMPPTPHLRRSDDGGATWQAMPLDEVALGSTPVVHVMAIDPQRADVVYLRSTAAVPPVGDKLYRSTDGGATFTEVLSLSEPLHGVAVHDGKTIAAAGTGGAYESIDGGPFVRVAGSPNLSCVEPRGDGALFACGANWEPDFFAAARSTDGRDWKKIVRFAEMTGPLSCPAGTVQSDTCELTMWPSLREQFGATGPAPACPAMEEPPMPPRASSNGGCCDGGGGPGAAMLTAIGAVLAALGLSRRQPRRSRS